MNPTDIYCSPAAAKADHPFEPLSAEFLAHCRVILGERAQAYGIEDGMADLREIFLRKLGGRREPGERVLLAATMMVALHDAVIASVPLETVPDILSLVAHDPRTLKRVADVDSLVPQAAHP